jgi:ribosomal protein S18 acetylase RimI-like enzyme
MTSNSASLPDLPVTIRSWRPEDADVCRVLFRDGLIGGKLSDADPGLDVDDIHLAYMAEPGNHFWVAENPAKEVIGMIGVQHHEPGVGEIRRLRVRQDSRRRGIGSKLLETAIHFCHDHGHLKITLDTYMEREPAIKLFEKFHFKHQRTRSINGKELLYFYLDIYGHSRKPPPT